VTCEEVERLLQDLRALPTERADIEAKASRNDFPTDGWQTITAFANSSGGLFLLGVRDATFEAVGVADPDRVQTHLTNVCADELSVPVRPDIRVCQIDGVTVIAARIPAARREERPVFKRSKGLPGGAYLRVGNTDRQMTMAEIRRVLLQQRDDLDSRAVYAASLDDLDAALITPHPGAPGSRSPHGSQPSVKEALAGLSAVMVEDGVAYPTLAGLLFFSREPQRWYPNLKITFTQYAGTDVGESTRGGVFFLDNRDIVGPVPRMIQDAVAVVTGRMAQRSVQEGLLRRDIAEYPADALREAIVNAVAHRDYSMPGAEIQIRLFSDRLEIQSPGQSLVPIEELTTGRATRNPVLMRLLREAGFVEERGIGIDRMIAAMARADMEPPAFDHVGESFQVTMKNHSLLSAESLEWLRGFAGYELNDRQRKALVVMRHGQEMTNAAYRALNFVDRSLATHELAALRDLGLAEQLGERRAARYVLPEALALGAGNDERVAAVVAKLGPELGRLYSELLFRQRARVGDLIRALGASRPTLVSRLKVLVANGLAERKATGPKDPTAYYVPKLTGS